MYINIYIYIYIYRCEPVHIHARCNVEQSPVARSSDVAEDRFFEQHSRTPYRTLRDWDMKCRSERTCGPDQKREQPLGAFWDTK